LIKIYLRWANNWRTVWISRITSIMKMEKKYQWMNYFWKRDMSICLRVSVQHRHNMCIYKVQMVSINKHWDIPIIKFWWIIINMKILPDVYWGRMPFFYSMLTKLCLNVSSSFSKCILIRPVKRLSSFLIDRKKLTPRYLMKKCIFRTMPRKSWINFVLRNFKKNIRNFQTSLKININYAITI
jgi:hypothetical protein